MTGWVDGLDADVFLWPHHHDQERERNPFERTRYPLDDHDPRSTPTDLHRADDGHLNPLFYPPGVVHDNNLHIITFSKKYIYYYFGFFSSISS